MKLWIKHFLIVTFIGLVNACEADIEPAQYPTDAELQRFEWQFSRWLTEKEEVPDGWKMIESESSTKLLDSDNLKAQLIINQSAQSNCLLVVTHPHYDIGTLEIAKSIFDSQCRGLLISGRHRKAPYANRQSQPYFEPTQHQQTYLHKIAENWSLKYPTSLHIQLHGFSQSKRRTLAGRTADVIVSSGDLIPSKSAQGFATCLKNSGFSNVMVYGTDVSELGGTKNAQKGSAIISTKFLHIELSRSLRKSLLKKPATINKITQCIVKL